MSTTPANPLKHTTVSYHLNFSFKIKKAKIVVKNGLVKKSIVA